jgi:hypothetical protein
MLMFGFSTQREAQGRSLASLCARPHQPRDSTVHYHESSKRLSEAINRSPLPSARHEGSSQGNNKGSGSGDSKRDEKQEQEQEQEEGDEEGDEEDAGLDPVLRAILQHSKDKGDYEIKARSSHQDARQPDSQQPIHGTALAIALLR